MSKDYAVTDRYKASVSVQCPRVDDHRGIVRGTFCGRFCQLHHATVARVAEVSRVYFTKIITHVNVDGGL